MQDLDVGPVQRADGRGTVHHELHVAGTAGLFSGGRDLFRQVRGRDHPLGQTDVVVRRIDDLEQVAGHRIAVNNGRHIVDQMNDFLGHVIARRGLAGKDLDPRHPWPRRIAADRAPAGDGFQNVQKLALVFVDALDLHVEQRIGADLDAQVAPDPS